MLEQLSIGSRPAKRNKSKDLKSLRAIPWVFAWTQIRFLLPAWLGIYEALNFAILQNKNIMILKDMLKSMAIFLCHDGYARHGFSKNRPESN